MRPAATALMALLAVPLLAGLRVEDAGGRPVANATVTILLDSSGKASRVFGEEPVVYRTDDRGTLPFALPRTHGAVVVVDHELHAPAIVTVAPGDTVRLQEGLTLRGRVTGEGETPPGPGTVCAIRSVPIGQSGRAFDVKRCASVEPGGTFTLRALAEGPQRLDVRVPAYLPLVKTITLPEGAWNGRLDPGKRALLQVEDAAGRGVDAATVECDGAVPVTADAHGAALVSVPSASASCRAFASDGAESPGVTIEAPSTARQTLRLRAPRLATGTLVANDGSDAPEARFTIVTKLGEEGQLATGVAPLPESREGVFRVRLPEEGPYALRIKVPGMLPLTTDWFTLPPGGGTADLGTLIVRRGAGLRGQAVDAATQLPLAGAVVSLEAQGRARLVLGSHGKASTVTDSDGSFLVAGVGIGSYRLRIESPGLPPFVTAADLAEESVRAAGTIALHRGVRLSGRVQRDDGEPLGTARIELVPSRLYDTEPVASADVAGGGAFGPMVIAPGLYRLLVRGDDLLSDQEIEVPAGEESLDVPVRIRSTRLTGILRDNGVPVSGGEVLLQRAAALRGNLGVALARNAGLGREVWSGRSDSQFSAQVNDAGVFSVDDVPAGRLVLEYFGTTGERVTRTVDVPDEQDASVMVDLGGWALQGRIDDGELESGLAARVELVDGNGTAVFRGTADGSGGFTIDHLAPGTYDLVASAEGYRSSDPLRVVVGNEAPSPLHLRLTKAAEATLDLELKRDDGSPAGGVAVAVVDAVGRQLRAVPTWPNGKLHVTGLPPGTVHVIFSDPLSGVGASAPIALRSGAQTVSMKLAPAKELVVRCESTSCSGTKLGSLALRNEHGIDLAPFLPRAGAVVYSAGGSALLGRLAPGTYAVTSSSGASRLVLGSGPGETELFVKR
ncbi:MAG TPA: carboxypeptidase regulatory-like domain-containing protein [Thermoanaerobaculia bacterium]|nr:carboxypeptidase regulatory-like domain-containing protein [Thermoanaerobaculia bacterium]